jgi:cytochrome b561
MALRSTAQNYGSVAKWLHWITALLFLGAYATVYYREWFTESRTPENWNALQLHFSLGVSIGVIVVLRIIWRIMDKSPNPEPGSPLAVWAAKLGHLALYGVMIAMPVTGYLGTGADTEFFFLFDIPSFKSTELFTNGPGQNMTFKEFEQPYDFIHKKLLGEWLLWMLILGHALAALYHHFVSGDLTLRKMTHG